MKKQGIDNPTIFQVDPVLGMWCESSNRMIIGSIIGIAITVLCVIIIGVMYLRM